MKKKMKYCKHCVYPFATVNLDIDENGISSSCKAIHSSDNITDDFWQK